MKCVVLLLCAALFILVGQPCQGAKVLGVFMMPSKSHYNLGNGLLKGLAERGHDVTFISVFKEKSIPKNIKYKQIILEGFFDDFLAQNMSMFQNVGMNPFLMLPIFTMMTVSLTEKVLENVNVQKLLKTDEKFDVVIIEQFDNDALKVLAHHFNASLILFSPMGANGWINRYVGNPLNPAYVSNNMLNYPPRMTFTQRLLNTAMTSVQEILHHAVMTPLQNRVLKRHFPNAPDLSVLNYDVSFVLLNSHISTHHPVPTTPNMASIGGYHVKPPEKLPEDLQRFLDNAKEGVVYFSMGSVLQCKDMPKEKRDAFVKAFAGLKQKVLWKWEEDVLPGKPDNVKLGKWLPQPSILAHPNVKLFITHGGILSTTETIYFGKPVIAVPVFGDQEGNADIIVSSGYGLKISYLDLNEEKLKEALQEILTNPKYAENAKKRSELFHDRPIKPMDEASYWVEYVARHQGAKHFRSSALDLSWYQYFLLDVMVVMSVISAAILFLIYFVMKTLIRCCCRGKSGKAKQKTN